MTNNRVSLTILALVFGVIFAVPAGSQIAADSWRQLVPLKSSRAEVEKVLGKPEHLLDGYAVYQNNVGRFHIWYSQGGCRPNIEGNQWNVSPGLMTSLVVYLNVRQPLTNFVSNVSGLRKESAPYNRTLYISPDESLVYEMAMGNDGGQFVYSVTVDPSMEQNKLAQCK